MNCWAGTVPPASWQEVPVHAGGLQSTCQGLTDWGGGGSGVQIIERGQIEVDIAELDFAQSKYVDPRTRALLGKIAGAEVAVLGAWQLAGPALRFTARFVDVETGEILAAAKVDGSTRDVFALQDALAVEANRVMTAVAARMRQ